MAWIEMIAEEQATGRLQRLYSNLMDPARRLVDNILRIHSLAPRSLETHFALYRNLMRGRSPLSKVQREMIAVVVSSANQCHY